MRALNARVGQNLVPIGRHSIMNGFGLETSPTPTDAEIDEFVSRFGRLIERINRLSEWNRGVVRRNLADMGRAHQACIKLADYIAAASELDLWRALQRDGPVVRDAITDRGPCRLRLSAGPTASNTVTFTNSRRDGRRTHRCTSALLLPLLRDRDRLPRTRGE